MSEACKNCMLCMVGGVLEDHGVDRFQGLPFKHNHTDLRPPYCWNPPPNYTNDPKIKISLQNTNKIIIPIEYNCNFFTFCNICACMSLFFITANMTRTWQSHARSYLTRHCLINSSLLRKYIYLPTTWYLLKYNSCTSGFIWYRFLMHVIHLGNNKYNGQSMPVYIYPYFHKPNNGFNMGLEGFHKNHIRFSRILPN